MFIFDLSVLACFKNLCLLVYIYVIVGLMLFVICIYVPTLNKIYLLTVFV